MPWTVDELEQLEYQFNNLASVPNYPGNYIVDRYLRFAFLDAYDENLDPAKSLQSNIPYINVEIARKRQEFRLETLELDGYTWPTLAGKRLRQADAAFDEIDIDAECKDLVEYLRMFMRGTKNNKKSNSEPDYNYDIEDYASLREFCDQLEEFAKSKNTNKYDTAIKYMRDAASALEVYENYK
jgi:hypothetical protein